MKRLLPLAILAFAAVSQAQVNYSSGFEPSTYAPGLLGGQDGWVAGSGGTSLGAPGVVGSPSPVFAGSQSVQLQGTTTGATFWSTGHAFAAGAPSTNTNLLTASAQIWVDTLAAGVDRYFGIGFGTAGTATSGFIGVGLGGSGLRGNGGSYASYNGTATGTLQARTVNDFLGRWVGVSFTADRSLTTNNVVFQFTNLGTSGGSATETFTKSVNFGTTNLTTVQLFADWDATSTNAGSAFFDNVSFGANPVPEPATMAALGIGAVALLRRRKKA